MEPQIILRFIKRFPELSVSSEFRFVRGFNVILGPSGCGKTTTLRVMCGLEVPDEGIMLCCGETFFDTESGLFLPPQRRKLGIVFQEDNLLPHMTVRGNIEFALSKGRGEKNKVEELLERFNLKGVENRYPSEISGGEKQRVAIVRAIAYNPRALLMDEPFSSLDFKIKLDIIEFMKSLDLNIPVVLVTHDPLEAIMLADRVFLMEKGRKTGEGGRELVEEYFSEIKGFLYFS